jgi:hypothetical protein
MMSLGKASLCQSEGLIKSNICWRHALAVMLLQGFYLPVVVQKWCCVQLAVAGC